MRRVDIGNGTAALLRSFSTAPATTFGVSPAEVFTFATTTTALVHFRITGTRGGQRAGIGEVIFRQASSIPEPGSLSLLGAAGLLVRLRRRARVRRPEDRTPGRPDCSRAAN